MMVFSGMIPVANNIVAGMGGAANYQSYNNFNYTVVQSQYGCKQSPTNSSSVGSCNPPSINNNLFSTFAVFGDFLDAMVSYIGAFFVGMFLPYWYLTNIFLLPANFAAAINGVVWISYAALLAYFLGNRNPEANY